MGVDYKKLKVRANNLLNTKVSIYAIIALIIIFAFSYVLLGEALAKPVYLDNTDPITYDIKATYYSSTGELTDDYWPFGYYFILGILYKIFGPGYITGKILNILFIIGIGLITYDLLRRKDLFKTKGSRIIFAIFGILILLDPEIRYYASTLYKEIGLVFFAFLILYLYTVYRPKGIYHAAWYGFLIAGAGMLGAQFNAWFIVPLFFGMLMIGIDIKSVSNTITKIKKHIPLYASILIAFLIFSMMVSSLYDNSTGNKHLFPTNGARLLFYMNAPTGCE